LNSDENSLAEGGIGGRDAILSSFLLVESLPFVKKTRLFRGDQPDSGRLSLIPT